MHFHTTCLDVVGESYDRFVAIMRYNCQTTTSEERRALKVFVLKPLSQLAHDHFKTLCDPAFWQSHDGSPTLHELSLPLHAIFRSPVVVSDF